LPILAPFGQRVSGHRPGDPVALRHVAAERTQQIPSARVSTPSATDFIPSWRAITSVASTMARSDASRQTPWTKLRSIFSSSKGMSRS
jgi:hypothetical protein